MRASKLQEWPAMMDQNQNPEDEHSEGGVLPGVRDGTAGVPGIVNTHRATHGREPSNSPSAHFHIRVDVPKPISQIVLSLSNTAKNIPSYKYNVSFEDGP